MKQLKQYLENKGFKEDMAKFNKLFYETTVGLEE